MTFAANHIDHTAIAKRRAILNEAWTALRARYDADPKPYAGTYKGVTNANESAWVKMGGKLDDLRAIEQRDSPKAWNFETANKGLAAVKQMCGA